MVRPEFKHEFYLDGAWTDVTSYVKGIGTYAFGISGWGINDRVASSGRATIYLKNDNNEFTPGHIDAFSGFQTGVRYRFTITYVGAFSFSRVRYKGFVPVDGLHTVADKYAPTVRVTILDFMERMATHEMNFPAFAQNKRMDEVMALILANLTPQPDGTDFDTGAATFDNVFDTVRDKTRALTEISKVARSELGYAYMRFGVDGYDDVLVSEGRYTRGGAELASVTRPIDPIVMLFEDGTEMLYEDGAEMEYEDEFSYEDAVFDNSFITPKVTHGRNYLNVLKTVAYPRVVDSSAVVLFQLDEIISVGAGETVTITGRYRDPDQKAQSVSGINMVTPVATTDYTMNTQEDGGGADLTSDLSITPTFGANGAELALENTGGTLGYVTKLQVRGYGVYTYRSVENTEEYAAGIADDGRVIETLDMQYQSDPLISSDFGAILLDLYSQKRTVIEEIEVAANRSEYLLCAFMSLDIGDKINVLLDKLDIDSEYFIHRIGFTIAPGGFLKYRFGLADAALTTVQDYWRLGTSGKSELGETTVLGF